jgi:hypothetical protein
VCSAVSDRSCASSSTEVLYVAERQFGTISLFTYDVNPKTAAAKQVGNPIFIGGSDIDPLAIGNEHYVYVWNPTDVWVYRAAANGAPSAQYSQHLIFNFPYPVNSFVVDPGGKFAYAAVIWPYGQGGDSAAVTLFTIDPLTGTLTDTQQVVATYSDYYTAIYDFSFGIKGNLLFARAFDNGPYTCNPEYDAYSVNEATGALGPLKTLVNVSADCGGTAEGYDQRSAHGSGQHMLQFRQRLCPNNPDIDWETNLLPGIQSHVLWRQCRRHNLRSGQSEHRLSRYRRQEDLCWSH